MYKRLLIFAVSIFIFLSFVSPAKAIYDPLSVSNNRFGIHIFNENDLEDAAKLVNTNNGDWGYVTLVITEGERDHARWQKAFDKMRRLHLIPIIRIATKPEGDNWLAPKSEEINNWIAFLNSLNWVVKNRYIVVGNEPNHAKEWGGKVSTQEYSNYLKEFSKALKSSNEDFYVLPAALDASAPNGRDTVSESVFIKDMLETNPDIFDYVDGWNSHSYPNPAFSGKETDKGRGTITTYDWELAYLEILGVKKNLPVFITETGWTHQVEGDPEDENLLAETEIGKRMNFAFENVWNDKRIVAVTPFTLHYISSPFDTFSWKKKDGTFYSFYNDLASVPKPKGEPRQDVKGKIIGVFINPFVIVGSSFKGVVLAQNLGQSIWVSPDVTVENESKNISITTEHFTEVEPQKFKLIYVSSEALEEYGTYKVPFVLQYKGQNISSSYPSEIVVIKALEVKKSGVFDRILGYLRNKISSTSP